MRAPGETIWSQCNKRAMVLRALIAVVWRWTHSLDLKPRKVCPRVPHRGRATTRRCDAHTVVHKPVRVPPVVYVGPCDSDEHGMELARGAARLSTLPAKVGCVLARDGGVLVSANNTMPGTVRETLERVYGVDRHAWQEHAERNAIYGLAASNGAITRGCTAYVTRFCCAECARCLIQSGIRRVCAPIPDFADVTWGRSWRIAMCMFEESGVEVVTAPPSVLQVHDRNETDSK